jgi:hypothetical protein
VTRNEPPDFDLVLGRETDQFARLIEGADDEHSISACPGWSLRDLAGHVEGVRARVTRAIESGTPFDDEGTTTWTRRLAHEMLVHRVDAEIALGLESVIDPDVASDGIDEWFFAIAPRVLRRGGAVCPDRSIHVHCTDVDGEWIAHPDGSGGIRVERVHEKGDAALRGAAASIFLTLWGRAPHGDAVGGHEAIGDPTAVEQWLAIGGV